VEALNVEGHMWKVVLILGLVGCGSLVPDFNDKPAEDTTETTELFVEAIYKKLATIEIGSNFNEIVPEAREILLGDYVDYFESEGTSCSQEISSVRKYTVRPLEDEAWWVSGWFVVAANRVTWILLSYKNKKLDEDIKQKELMIGCDGVVFSP
jgi:hypothetical protein